MLCHFDSIKESGFSVKLLKLVFLYAELFNAHFIALDKTEVDFNDFNLIEVLELNYIAYDKG